MKHLLFPHRSWREILLDSFVKIFCFSDIQNLSSTILEYINTWFIGDVGYGEHRKLDSVFS